MDSKKKPGSAAVPAEMPPGDGPVELPMDGVLDLHTFRPRELGGLIPDWLAACQERGLLELRIIHGKGIGNVQRSVHAILARHPEVVRYGLAGAHYGGSGATIVHLRAPPRQEG
ncbi:MAG: Smr/MutS family protein [Verrucomicrobiota bacterium]|jgi:DNA-nicking Smr family endonuclease